MTGNGRRIFHCFKIHEGSEGLKSKNTDTQDNKLNIFRLLRIARDIKVKDLAQELSVTPAYINAIENGERFPSDRLLKDYAQALGVEKDTILNIKLEDQKNKKFENVLLSLLQMICNTGN